MNYDDPEDAAGWPDGDERWREMFPSEGDRIAALEYDLALLREEAGFA